MHRARRLRETLAAKEGEEDEKNEKRFHAPILTSLRAKTKQ
jgi:hypothetical protein